MDWHRHHHHRNDELEYVTITGVNMYSGILAGATQESSTVENVHVRSSQVQSYKTTGLLIGNTNDSTSVRLCSVTDSTIQATNSFVGGMFGKHEGGQVEKSFVSNVTVNALTYIGGIAGRMYTGTRMDDVYSVVTASGQGYVGGLVGEWQASSTISHAYSVATISRTSGTQTTFGSVKGASGGTSNQIYFSNAAVFSGGVSDNGLLGTPLSPAQLKMRSSFDPGDGSGWDFSSIWKIDEGNAFPVLIENAG